MRKNGTNEQEREDRNRNGIDDMLEPPMPNVTEGTRKLAERLRENNSSSPELSGGDVDAKWEMAESAGEETAGASAATPDQDRVDEIGSAYGVTYQDDETLKLGEKERSRDKERWELDPASSEDYRDRNRR